MAKFANRESHLDSYKRTLLAHIEKIHGKLYADDVKRHMKGKK